MRYNHSPDFVKREKKNEDITFHNGHDSFISNRQILLTDQIPPTTNGKPPKESPLSSGKSQLSSEEIQ